MNLRNYYSEQRKIAVTGATGFVGRRLLEMLGADTFAPKNLEEVPPGATVVHLASDVTPSREAFVSNLDLDSYLVDIVNRKHSSLIYASSNNVYKKSLDCRIDEASCNGDFYSLSKVFGEQLIKGTLHKPYAILRIGDVFGRGQRHGNFFKAIENALRNREPLKQYGRGLKRRNYIHVDELCSQIRYLALNINELQIKDKVYNVAYLDHASIEEILEAVSRLSGLRIVNHQLENDESCLDLRTMKIDTMETYVPIWRSFREALTAYVAEIRDEK